MKLDAQFNHIMRALFNKYLEVLLKSYKKLFCEQNRQDIMCKKKNQKLNFLYSLKNLFLGFFDV